MSSGTDEIAGEDNTSFLRNSLASDLSVPATMLSKSWLNFATLTLSYYLSLVYFLMTYSTDIVKYINDLRNPSQCSVDSDVCEYVSYCRDYTLNVSNNRLKDMFSAACFAIILMQIFRMVYIAFKDNRSNYLSIYISSMVVMFINFSAEYLNISQNVNIQCTDANGVTIPVIFTMEWHITVPAMLYMVLALDSGKNTLTYIDYKILICGVYTIVASMLCNLMNNKIVGHLLILSAVTSLSYLMRTLFIDCQDKLKYYSDQKNLALLDPQQYIQVSILTRRQECAYLLASMLPVFGTVYFFQYFKVITTETSHVLLHFANILSKVCLNISLCEAHLEMLNPREYNLITERKANDVKRAFIRYIFHEVRSPLNSILIGLSTLIKDEELKKVLSNSTAGSSTYEVLHLMKESASNLGETLNDVLNLQKLEEKVLKVKVHPFETFSLTKVIEANYGDAVSDKSLNFKIIYKQGIPLVIFGDETYLKHAIMNIISNACSFTSKDGNIVVVVDTKNDNRDLMIQILDDGVSFRESDINTLFLPYATLNTSIKRQERALGIGLAISHDIIKLHGGSVNYHLNNGQMMHGIQPQGIFTISLPIRNTSFEGLAEEKVDVLNLTSKPAPKEVSNSSNDPIVSISAPSNDQLHVLIVDDVRSNWKILQMLITKRNIRSDVAENGVDAVEMVRSEPKKYQIIFMDNMMPKMTGVEATKLIRLAGFEGIIMGLTGNTLEKDVEEFENAGATLVLPKPLNHRHLDKLLSIMNSATYKELLSDKLHTVKDSFKDLC